MCTENPCAITDHATRGRCRYRVGHQSSNMSTRSSTVIHLLIVGSVEAYVHDTKYLGVGNDSPLRRYLLAAFGDVSDHHHY